MLEKIEKITKREGLILERIKGSRKERKVRY